MRIVTRDDWGARSPVSRRTINIPTAELWIHHTATEQHGAAGVQAIQAFHMDSKGWSDIAYSFLVDDDGTVFEGRGAGVAGGHTKGHNTVSHAICALGNLEEREPTAAQVQAFAELVRHGQANGWWRGITGGHREVGQTACPGKHLFAQLGAIQAMADGAAAASAPAEARVGAGAATPVHVIAAGETLSRIARDNGMTLAQLLELNPQFRPNPNLIHPGDPVVVG